ncbi:MAG: hypothetical protein HYV94_02745, partial [Candidatus Rokubacteria bacterium]|nr:hypothetical protein [Candidatus Rokubacteria bacterium]
MAAELQKYKAGYLVVLLIAARVTWRVYRSVSRRREKAKQALVPTQPGQAALHEHLVDMDEVTLRAAVKEQPIDGGLRIEISGTGRTLAAIRRMVPAHAQELNHSPGWEAKAESVADGAVLTATSTDPKEVAHIRGLGFIGLLARGMR